MSSPRHVCLYQDNPAHFVSVQLAVLSIVKHEPQWKIHVSIPDCPEWLERWIARYDCCFLYKNTYGEIGWNVKPEIIIFFLDLLQEEVIWLDCDIILTSSLSMYIGEISATALILAEDPPGLFPPGSELRTTGWDLPIGRSIVKSINSCFVRVLPAHRDLIRAWQEALLDARYRKAQQLKWWLRPAPFFGDQDALSALLGSKDYSDVEIIFLRNGVDIAQCHGPDGYSWQHRIKNSFRKLPALIHAQGKKPWLPEGDGLIYLDVSPYKLVARHYFGGIDSTKWLRISTLTGRLLMILSFGEPNLAGMLPAMATACRRKASSIRKLWRSGNTIRQR